MPSAVLKSLAKQAGESLETAEKFWSEAKKSAKAQEGVTDEHAYAIGIVKKRLGLENTYLALVGFPARLLVEAEMVKISGKTAKPPSTVAESFLLSLYLKEFYDVEKFKRKSRVCKEDLSMRPTFKNLLETITKANALDHWRKIFPNVPDTILAYFVQGPWK